jgi:hypothetical protein
MNKLTQTYSAIVAKAGHSKVKLVLFLLVLVLFVLGSGAPEDGGGIINSLPFFWF